LPSTGSLQKIKGLRLFAQGNWPACHAGSVPDIHIGGTKSSCDYRTETNSLNTAAGEIGRQ
jgi:hypothetical protein